MKSKIKWAALAGLVLSFVSLLVHLLLAKSSADLVQYSAIKSFSDDLNYLTNGVWRKKLWGQVQALQGLRPYTKPRTAYPAPDEQNNNGFIYAKIFGGFEKIKNSICDLVTISRLLNATLVIPDIQETLRSKGISSKFKSFSYIYDEKHFIAALSSDVIVVSNLPPNLEAARKKKQYPTFRPQSSASPNYYLTTVLPELKKVKVIGLLITDGGCLQPALLPSMAEYQRLRCRVSYDALRFRSEIATLGQMMVERLRAFGQPYLAYHPGLKRDTLAYHGCAELFQDIHTELIQYRRRQLIKQGVIKADVDVDSHSQKPNGSCPLMPEEVDEVVPLNYNCRCSNVVGLLLRAMGYPPRTRIYIAGSETFGGQRVLIPFRSIYTNLVDRTSLCSKQELANVIGHETPLSPDPFESLPAKSLQQQKEDWDKAGPRPRPLPPPPGRPVYRHEKEGWYGWVAEKERDPDPSPSDLREQAHRVLWDALDYIVSVEADAFFPGFANDGSGWPDYASLIMGHRIYKIASVRTYRPDRKYISELFNTTSDHLYYPPHNWTLLVRDHLNKSVAEEGLYQFQLSKPKSFLSHPFPECSCTTLKTEEMRRSVKGSIFPELYKGLDECPKWLAESFVNERLREGKADEVELQDDETDLEGLLESDGNNQQDSTPSLEQDEEMDPDD